MKAKRDIYQDVTNKVIEQMESAKTSWVNPMIQSGGVPMNPTTGKKYNGINRLLLGFTGARYFASYKQWEAKGCQVQRGERGTGIVFYKVFQKHDKATGEEVKIPVLRSYTVFSISQVKGDYADELLASEQEGVTETDRDTLADEYIKNTGATIIEAFEGKAFYRPSTDSIQVPPLNGFKATPTSTAKECYYSTVFHELTHWTGAKSRLDRLDDKSRDGYAYEELIAELGAAYQCQTLKVSAETREDHAQYLNSWIAALKNDKRLIHKAAAQAQKAVDYLEGLAYNDQNGLESIEAA